MDLACKQACFITLFFYLSAIINTYKLCVYYRCLSKFILTHFYYLCCGCIFNYKPAKIYRFPYFGRNFPIVPHQVASKLICKQVMLMQIHTQKHNEKYNTVGCRYLKHQNHNPKLKKLFKHVVV